MCDLCALKEDVRSLLVVQDIHSSLIEIARDGAAARTARAEARIVALEAAMAALKASMIPAAMVSAPASDGRIKSVAAGGSPAPGVRTRRQTLVPPTSVARGAPAEIGETKEVSTVVDLELERAYRQAQDRVAKSKAAPPKSLLDQLLDLIAEFPEPARSTAYDALQAHFERAAS